MKPSERIPPPVDALINALLGVGDTVDEEMTAGIFFAGEGLSGGLGFDPTPGECIPSNGEVSTTY